MLKQIQFFLENLIVLSEFVDAQINEIQTQTATLSKGSIRQKVAGGKCYFYHCTIVGGKRIQRYISSDEAAELAGQTQKRHLLEQSLKYWKRIQATLSNEFGNEYSVMLADIKKLHNRVDEKSKATISLLNDEDQQIFLEASGAVSPKLQSNETIRLHNSNDSFILTSDIPSKYGDGNIETLEEGTLVRSKSELLIIEQLKASGLEYYYEQGIVLNNRVYYPDFLIKHPVSGDFLIWEHCGLVENNDYFENLMKKLDVYAKHGIHSCDNLILTYEKGNSGFSLKRVRDMINFYFV